MSVSYHHSLPRLTLLEDSRQSQRKDSRMLTLIWFPGKTKLRGILTHTYTDEGAYLPSLPQCCFYDGSLLSTPQVSRNGDTSRYATCLNPDCLCLYEFPPEQLIPT